MYRKVSAKLDGFCHILNEVEFDFNKDEGGLGRVHRLQLLMNQARVWTVLQGQQDAGIYQIYHQHKVCHEHYG